MAVCNVAHGYEAKVVIWRWELVGAVVRQALVMVTYQKQKTLEVAGLEAKENLLLLDSYAIYYLA
jgi:hypothetical protein